MAFCDDALRSGMEGTPTNFCSLLSNVKHRYPPTQRDSTHSPASSSSACKVAKTIYGTYQTVRSYEFKFQSVHADIHIVLSVGHYFHLLMESPQSLKTTLWFILRRKQWLQAPQVLFQAGFLLMSSHCSNISRNGFPVPTSSG